MRNASGHQGENERREKEKKNREQNTCDISSIKRVTRRFHVVVVQNKSKLMY